MLIFQSKLILANCEGPSWVWLYGSRVYNYICNQCLSLLKLWVLIQLMVRCVWYNIMWSVCQWLVAGRWFSPYTLVSSTNTNVGHDTTEILLNGTLKPITLTLTLIVMFLVLHNHPSTIETWSCIFALFWCVAHSSINVSTYMYVW